MPRRGYDQSFSSGDFAVDPTRFTPSAGTVFDAGFRHASQFTLGRQAIERGFLETEQGPGDKLTVEQANQEYGLDLKPTFATSVSRSLAEHLSRKRQRDARDQQILQQSESGFGLDLASGFAASLTDPVEFGASALLPLTRLGQAAATSANAGRLVSLSTTARFLRRFPNQNPLRNPFLAGAVEGGVDAALLSPGIYFNSNALGVDYSVEDAFTDVAASGFAGGALHLGGHALRSAFSRGASRSVSIGPPVDGKQAYLQSELDFAEGRGVNIDKSVNAKKVLQDLDVAQREVEESILSPAVTEPEGTLTPERPVSPLESDPTRPVETPNTAEVSQTTFALPNSLKRSAPRFGQTRLEFESDLDKALYIIGKRGNKSKAHDQFEEWVASVLPDLSDDEIGQLAVQTRQRIIDRAKAGDGTIPTTNRVQTEPAFEATPVNRPTKKPPLQPLVFESEEALRHTTPLERRIGAAVDPEGYKVEIQRHLKTFSANYAKLAELMSLKESERLASLDDIHVLQDDLLAAAAELNELIPVTDTLIRTDLPTTQKGIFNRKSFTALGKEIDRLNEIATREIDETGRLTLLKADLEASRAELKRALKNEAQARTKGSSTLEKWQDEVARLVPQVEHTSKLIQSLGEDIEVPELSFENYIATLGDNVSPELRQFIVDNPDLRPEALYRVRRQIVDNVMSRMNETREYVRSIQGPVTVSRFPENDAILADIKKELAEIGDTVDSTQLTEVALEKLDTQFTEAKALGIFDDAYISRIDKIQEDFKAELDKVDAVKKGSLQAQLCALQGADDE
jgi:hypothetical protein